MLIKHLWLTEKNLYKALSKSDYEFFWISAIKTKQQTQVG